jgi:hypothetical protein
MMCPKCQYDQAVRDAHGIRIRVNCVHIPALLKPPVTAEPKKRGRPPKVKHGR